ncbi:unnamed protein product [Calicophoron daubneyi]|uniref:Protein kinase domain-containing protein n=1 Tax=Calicophoron daubneyi TaxID=300641 RepID=A0AAV2U1S4_CALDB
MSLFTPRTSAPAAPSGSLIRNRPTSASCRYKKFFWRRGQVNFLSVDEEMEAADRVNLTRNHSVRTPEELPPNMDETELEVLGTVGTGAFGRALQVRHKQFGCLLVLKEVLNECKEDEEALVREISLLRNLKHPNLLTCIGVVVRKKRICLVTEFIARGSLHNVLLGPSRRPLSWCTKGSFARDISAGMSYLHQNGLIHRDLTTFNCLVRLNNSVVVSDFGLSKIVNPDRYSIDSLQQAGRRLSANKPAVGQKKFRCRPNMSRRRRHTVVGSPFWMAPEMLAGAPYDGAVDVYSFGVIICQLLGNCSADPDEIPRDDTTMSVNLAKFLSSGAVSRDAPFVLMQIAARCISIDPEKRPKFATCLDWFDDLLLYLTTGRMPPANLLANGEGKTGLVPNDKTVSGN